MDLPDADAAYTRACGERTLQEERRGFFGALAEECARDERVADWARETWARREYGAACVRRLAGPVYEKLAQTFTVQPVYRKKNADAALKARRLAAKEAQAGNHQMALAYCNQAVVLSPPPPPDGGDSPLAASLWLRAECLMKLGNDDLALRDLQAAIKSNPPKAHRGALFQRQGECYKKLDEPARARISFELAERLLQDNPTVRQKLLDEIRALKDRKGESGVEPKSKAPLPSAEEEEETPPTSTVGVEQQRGKGRYAIAARDISVGETVVQEKPYAACLKQSSNGTHCHHCFERLRAPYGCADCANLAFCSPECRDAACDGYHKYECQFMDLFVGSGMSVLCHVALRMVTQNGLRKSLDIHDRYLVPRERLTSGYDDQHETEVRLRDRLHVIYNLCTHTEQRTYEDYLSRALMAFFLLRCLQRGGFFGDGKESDERDGLTEDELKIMTMLLYHLQMLHFNAHEIEEVQRAECERTNSFKFKPIGVGIYPVVSLFNHDCHQGVARYFVGRTIVMRALRPFAAGEPLPENYGPVFTRHAKYARQRILRSRYWFLCECRSCDEIWPSLEQMSEAAEPTLRCTEEGCRGKIVRTESGGTAHCSTCAVAYPPDSHASLLTEVTANCFDKYAEADSLMIEKKYAEAAEVLSAALERFYSMAHAPHPKTQRAEQKLKSCFGVL